jgi:indole-3-glycerol phosphate synthase
VSVGRPLPDILAQIAGAVQERLASEPEPPDLQRRAVEAAAARRRAGRRSLHAALRAPGVRVIAECKRRSPSAGWLRERFEPVALAAAYQEGGAAAISVVTEPRRFAGRGEWVPTIRRAVPLPVLQKDFVLSQRQLAEMAVLGADAALLIVRLVSGGLLGELVSAAAALELETLLEVHDEDDLDRALELRPSLVGVNARDLATFKVDPRRAAELAARVPKGTVVVMESGITGPAALRGHLARGLRCFLVGEYLLRSADPAAALAELVAVA